MALKDQNDAWEIFSLIPSAIRVPENYGRRDLGDLAELAESIDRFGLLSPILVHIDDDGEYVLRAGLRRLRACESVLGWQVVPVLAVNHLHEDTGEAMEAFRDENTQRKALTPSEAVGVADVIRARVGSLLAERRQAGRKAEPSGKLPEGRLEAREIAAEAVGYSATTLRSARELLHLVDSPEMKPAVREQVQQKVELMDSTGNVSRALREARELVAPGPRTEEPTLRQAWTNAGVAVESMVKALDVAVSALDRDVQGPDAVIDDDDLDTAESSALRALELIKELRKARLQVVGGE